MSNLSHILFPQAYPIPLLNYYGLTDKLIGVQFFMVPVPAQHTYFTKDFSTQTRESRWLGTFQELCQDQEGKCLSNGVKKDF